MTLIPEHGEVDALVDRVVDGDTFSVCLFVPIQVRLAGVQVAERNTEKGKLVARKLADRLSKQVVTLRLQGRDKYGRQLAGVQTSDGKDLAEWLIGLGLAVPWDGRGPRPVGQQQEGDTGEFPAVDGQ